MKDVLIAVSVLVSMFVSCFIYKCKIQTEKLETEIETRKIEEEKENYQDNTYLLDDSDSIDLGVEND